LILIVLAEVFLRVCQLDRPRLGSPYLPSDFEALHQDDPDLFFSLRPNLDGQWDGAHVKTSSLGLRSAEIGPKQPREFRILSLGESTTFGARLDLDQSYSGVLEKLLQDSDSSRKYSVINAGVSAYSSFQSLKYLELRGLQLQPDMVLFYHEINDFLPTALRTSEALEGSESGEASLALSDRQLYESRRHVLHRKLLAVSAVYRCLHHVSARQRLKRLQEEVSQSETDPIVIPVAYRQVFVQDEREFMRLPTRVSVEERKDIFHRLVTVCKEQGIQLVVIHPSYRDSERHTCELTEVCEAMSAPMFEAYDSLHPAGEPADKIFLDSWHPSPLGHRMLAEDLFTFIKEYPWPDGE